MLGWRGTVRRRTAESLLRRLPRGSVATLVVHPPDKSSSAQDPTTALLIDYAPVAEEAYRVLRPGGVTIFLGGPRQTGAWEVAAGWGGLQLLGEIVVVWDRRAPGEKRQRDISADAAGLTTGVRWHLRPGYRGEYREGARVESNVVVCPPVPFEDRRHPRELPVNLCVYLLSLLAPRGLVVDPYCGSGSVLVAAEILERPWIGGDENQGVVEAARERMADVETEDDALRDARLWLWRQVASYRVKRGRMIDVEAGELRRVEG